MVQSLCAGFGIRERILMKFRWMDCGLSDTMLYFAGDYRITKNDQNCPEKGPETLGQSSFERISRKFSRNPGIPQSVRTVMYTCPVGSGGDFLRCVVLHETTNIQSLTPQRPNRQASSSLQFRLPPSGPYTFV